MDLRVLTKSEIEQFIELGWVKVEEAFPRKQALACQAFLWKKLEELFEFVRNDPTTWDHSLMIKPGLLWIKESFNNELFMACNTERLQNAVEDIVGRGRWPNKDSGFGVWPVNFPVHDYQWDVPTMEDAQWHWDRKLGQKDYVTFPGQSITQLCMFSDVSEQSGGTCIAEASHNIVINFLNRFPEGIQEEVGIPLCAQSHPWLAELIGEPCRYLPATDEGRIERLMNKTHIDQYGNYLKVIKVTANAGDIVLFNRFAYHSRSLSTAKEARFLCNRSTSLRELRLDRTDGTDSPFEISLKRAIAKGSKYDHVYASSFVQQKSAKSDR